MNLLLRMSLLVGVALLHAGCATSPVTRRDTLGAQTPKGFVEFYVGVSGAAPVPETLILVLAPDSLPNNATAQPKPWWIRFGLFDRTPFTHESQTVSYGSAKAHAFGGTRLRVACAPGTNTFLLAPNVNQAVGGPERSRMVTVDVMEHMVTPVRAMVDVLSVTNRGNLVEYDISWTVAPGNPQRAYDLVSSTYRYKDGPQALGIANTVSTLIVECKDAQELQDTKRRLDQAHMGLNLGKLADRAEFVKRYHESSPKKTPPQGVMIRLTTLNGLQWLPAIALTE